ncbi:BTAD domain-containing putative transcriptional regulator [uncultured Oscillibacter sp.]|uniref:BTAD domain-containing putative transcriptional regulator n=1 Tax=uncultured Oscillibacter sp. TaxID=876091 RepID=UPI00261C859C|nr:BTAD domain-containing putative transcriptional regulator [uncultured Oscillibacter sp.]
MAEFWRTDLMGAQSSSQGDLEYSCLEKSLREGIAYCPVIIDVQTGCGRLKAIENFFCERGEYYFYMDVQELTTSPSTYNIDEFIENLTSFCAENGIFIQRPAISGYSEREIWNQFLRQCAKADRAPNMYIILERFCPDNDLFNHFLWKLERYTGRWLHFIFLMNAPLPGSMAAPLFQQAYRISFNNFLMTMKEAKLCLEKAGNSVDDSELRTIWLATAGWALPANLLFYKAKRDPNILDDVRKSPINTILYLPELYSFFQNTLFTQMTGEETELLLKCSVDNQLSDPYCRYLGIGTGAASVSEIAEKCPYITCLNFFEQVYSINPVVQSFLYHTAKQKYGEAEMERLHTAAAAYFTRQKDWKRILSHNLLLGNLHDAAYTFRYLAFDVSSHYQSEDFKELVRRSHMSILERDPWVQFAYAIAVKYQYPDISLQYFQKAMGLFAENNDIEGEILSFCQTVSLGFFSEAHKSVFLNQEMLTKFYTEPNAPLCEDTVLDCYRKVFLAYAYIQLGKDIGLASAWLKDAEQTSVVLQNKNLRLWVDFVRILYYANRPDSQQLRFYVTKALELAETGDVQLELKMYLYQTSAFIYFIKSGLYEQARNHCEEARILAYTIGATSYLVYINLIYTYALDCLREFDLAEQIILETENTARNILNIRNEHLWAYYMIGQAYHYYLKGDWQAAFYAADNGISYSRRSKRNSYLARALLVMCSIQLRQGNLQQAGECIGECLSITKSGKYFFYRLSALYQEALIHYEDHGDSAQLKLELQPVLEQARQAEIAHFNFTAPWDLPRYIQEAGLDFDQRFIQNLCALNSAMLTQPSILYRKNGKKELSIQLFGGFHCYWKKKDLAIGIPQKARYLLELLAISNEPLGIAKIIEELWPNQSQKKAMNNFYFTLHQIRKALGKKDFVRYEQKRCWLDSDYYSTDVQEFSQWKKRGQAAYEQGDWETCAACFDNAVALYRGELLAEEELEDSLDAERRAVERDVYYFCMDYGALLLRNDNSRKGIEVLQKITRNEFAQEDLLRLLMIAHYMLGARGEALKLYQELEKVLMAEMDVAPHVLSRQIYEDIKNGKDSKSILQKLL